MGGSGTGIRFSAKRGGTDGKAEGEARKVNPWPENFPKVITMTNLPNLKSKKNGNYNLHGKAKAGDIAAAAELVAR